MADSAETSADAREIDWPEAVARHRKVWDAKPALRRIYTGWFRWLRRRCLPGSTLEVGGGSGRLKAFWPAVVSSDVIDVPWLDVVADVHALPFEAGSFDNVVGVDVLHHLADVDVALGEIARVLRCGGRAVFVEPYISPLSHWVRRRFHHEDIRLDRESLFSTEKRPEEANLAIPTLLFDRHRRDFGRRFPGLRVLGVELSDPLAYPLTGGYSHPSLLPQGLLTALWSVEPALGSLSRWLAFKMRIVLEATGAKPAS